MGSASNNHGSAPLKVLALEPYFGGSHREFLLAYQANSRHDVRLLTMPARKWKWRMRGACLHFAAEGASEFAWADCLLASDFVNLAELFGLLGGRKPSAVYFHENQMTYPVRFESERDYHFAFTNITTALAADAAIFNSEFHRRDFLSGVEKFIRLMPDYRPSGVAEKIEARSCVIYPGIEIRTGSLREGWGDPPTVLFNHRWDFDKCPEEFFAAMGEVARDGCDFRLAVTGEVFGDTPPAFDQARETFKDKIVQFGFADSARYAELLAKADIVVSTAVQEFFGISVAEAISRGAWPLAPNRLSYPEIIPRAFHASCLYGDRADLVDKMKNLLREGPPAGRERLSESMKHFSRERTARELDAVWESI